MRNDFIKNRLDSLLRRLSPPRAIAKSADLQREEAGLIAQAINSAMPTQNYEEWWTGFEDRLLSSLQTRAWPTLREIKDAARTPKGSVDVSLTASLEVDRAIDYFNEHKRPHPGFNTIYITKQLLERGVLQDIRDAKWRGFELTRDDLLSALKMRPGYDEWQHHCTVLACLNNISFQEAQKREVAALSPDQLPQHLVMEAAE